MIQVYTGGVLYIFTQTASSKNLKHRKMQLKAMNYLELPASADMHVHLRQGAMMDFTVLQIRPGGVDTVFVCCVKRARKNML
jgi:hypothetical protein